MKTMWRASFVLFLAGCGHAAMQPAAPPRTLVQTDTQIISPDVDGTARELLAKGERALLLGNFEEAKQNFEALVAAEPKDEILVIALLDLGASYEGLGDREKARDTYQTLTKRFAQRPEAKQALVRLTSIYAYMDDFTSLREAADALLARPTLEPYDRVTALGARGLAKVELGDDIPALADVMKGLTLAEDLGLGYAGRLPANVAQLRFALGEVRRVQMERIALMPVTDDFVAKVGARCQGLLDAQSSYADAMRSTDPQWSIMSGFRVGQMYRTLHKDLMSIPSDGRAKNDKDRQVFYGIMHVRYRALLDKGIEMLRRTIALAEKVDDKVWLQRLLVSKQEMDDALAEEKAILKTYPFTEEELEKALALMEKHFYEKQQKSK